VRADAGNSDDYLNDEELAADAAVNDTFLRSEIRKKERSFIFPTQHIVHSFLTMITK
jgi:hypothetical protein